MSSISIIVPAYNVEQYIKKCIDSLLKQTYEDYEILLVDDGSTDATVDLCDEIGRLDKRIRVFHKKNGGLSDARNFGIRMSNSKYITFIDGDDYVSNTYLETLIKMIKNDVDIAMVSTQSILEQSSPKSFENNDISVITAKEAVRMMLLRQNFSHCGVGKLYKRDLWRDFYFPKGRLYEDYLTTFEIFSRAKNVSILDNKSYYYIQRIGSIMHYKCSPNTISILDVADEVTERICLFWPDLKHEAIDLQIASYLKCLQTILNSNPNSFKEAQDRILKRNRKVFFSEFLSNIPIKDKMKMLLLLFGKKVFINIYNKCDGDIKV